MIRTASHSAFFSLLLVQGLIAQTPADVVTKILEEGRDRSQVMQHLDTLVNEIGPRLTGSERLTRACEWARDQFKSFGIESARITRWGEVEVGFDRGTDTGFAIVGAERRALTFGTDAWTPGTDGPKRGKAVLAPEEIEDADAFAETLAGAWLVQNPKAGPRGGTSLRGVARKGGALGVVADGGDLIITSGNMRTKWDKLPTQVSINLWTTHFRDLAAELEAGADVELEFDVQNRFKQGPIELFNVLAEIPGTEHPDQFVIVGGHIDSWDGATGTTDNGTGCATTIEAARLLMAAGAKPRRTIRFMLWSGEEQGLLGSRAYIKDHDDESERISAVLVHDGGTNYASGITATEPMVPLFEQVFAPVIGLDPALPFEIRKVRALPRGIGSDHDSYLARGVPGFFWLQDGKAVYRRTHHSQHDTFDAAVPEYQRHTAVVTAIGALGIANLDELLPRGRGMAAQPNPAVNLRRLGVQLAEAGLTVIEVGDDSRAKAAGIVAGDVILRVDDQPVETRDALASALNGGGPNKKVSVRRAGAEVDVTVEFAR